MSKLSPSAGESIRPANSRYCSNVSISSPGSGSISSITSHAAATSSTA